MTLSSRISSLTGPDRAVDAEVAVALSDAPDARVVWRKGRRWFSAPGPGRIPFAGCGGKGCRLGLTFQTVRFTADLNAAMSAVPEGAEWIVEAYNSNGVHPEHVRASAWVYGAERMFAATPALALLAAALKARGL